MNCLFETDYLADFHYHCEVEPLLAPLEAAGIADIFWTQQGEGDFIYLKPEMQEIEQCVRRHGMNVGGVAAPHVFGPMRNCWSDDELKRETGLRLVENRMELAQRLGARIVWMPAPSPLPKERGHIMRSVERLVREAERHDVVLAMENCLVEELAWLLETFGERRLAWCMHAARCSLGGSCGALLKRYGDRLALVRAGDCTGYGMQRLLPFSGCIDWPTLIAEIAAAAPSAVLSLDVDVYSHLDCSQMEFLSRARRAGERLAELWGRTE